MIYFSSIGALFLLRHWSCKGSVSAELVNQKDRQLEGHSNKIIIGGRAVDPVGRYPYMIEFDMLYDGTRCSGTLIHPKVVLTTARCVKEPGSLRDTLDIGRHNIKKPSSNDKFETIGTADFRVLFHPSLYYNLVVILLKENSTTMPVKLSDDKNDSPQGTNVIVMGYGRVDDNNNNVSNKLKEADLEILSDNKCSRMGANNEFEICAEDPQGGSFIGDEGGPIIVDGGSASADLQVGIVLQGHKLRFPRVSCIRSWIEETMKEEWGLTLGDGIGSTQQPVPTPQAPFASPSASPTASPSASPTASPSASPTASPSASPTASPSASPTASPSALPTASPSASPTAECEDDPKFKCTFSKPGNSRNRKGFTRKRKCKWFSNQKEKYIKKECERDEVLNGCKKTCKNSGGGV